MKIEIKLQSPIIIKKSNGYFGWKRKAKDFAKQGKALDAVKEIKMGKDISFKEAKDYWDKYFKDKYYKLPKS